jgi:uncharacterized protein YgiB involved in biofilm formation
MTQPIKRKRSSSLTLTTMVAAGAGLTVAACDSSNPAQWNEVQPRSEQVEAFQYATLQACKDANEIPDAACETGYAAAQKDDAANSPRYNQQATCEEVYGQGNCVPRSAQGGGSFWGPLLAGFVVGRMLDGGGYYRGTGLYRQDERYGGGYTTGWGGSMGRDYVTGRTTLSRSSFDPPDAYAPPKAQTRTSVVSRGGFGGGRGFGG